MKAAVEYS